MNRLSNWMFHITRTGGWCIKKKSTKSSYVKSNYFKSIWRLYDVSTSQSPKEILKIVMKTKLLTSKWFIKKVRFPPQRGDIISLDLFKWGLWNLYGRDGWIKCIKLRLIWRYSGCKIFFKWCVSYSPPGSYSSHFPINWKIVRVKILSLFWL